MGSQPSFLTTSLDVAPATPEAPHYEGVPADALLPPKGVPVYTDHPIFKRDELLADEHSSAAWCYVVVEQNKMYTEEYRDTFKRWLLGEIPIPEEDLEAMINRRPEYAEQRGIPLTKCREGEPYPHPSEVQAELAEAEAKQVETETEQAEALLAMSSESERVAMSSESERVAMSSESERVAMSSESERAADSGGLVSRLLSVFRRA